jgi:hypothetical protein
MKVRYDNQQDDLDPMNGGVFSDQEKLIELLDSRRNDPPFAARLSGDNGFELMIGIGGDVGCVQYSHSNGDLPYLMAVPPGPQPSGDVEFLMGGTATPIPARYILSFDELKKVVLYFLETGDRINAVSWEAI